MFVSSEKLEKSFIVLTNDLYVIFVEPKSCIMEVDNFSLPQNLMRSEEKEIKH